MNKKIKGLLIIIFNIFIINAIFLTSMQTVNAGNIEIVEGEGSYTIDIKFKDAISVATEQAKEAALRMATEQAGVYVKSYTETLNGQLTQDKIIVIASSIMEILEEEPFVEPTDDRKGIKVVYKIKARVDTSKIDTLLEKEILLQQASEENKQKDKQIQELQEQIKRLTNQYEKTASENRKQEIEKSVDESRRKFQIAKYEKDIDLFYFGGKTNQQIDIIDTAQKLGEIDPQNAAAFRAMAYYYRGKSDVRRVMNLCNDVLKSKYTPDLGIVAMSQLGDIYFNELNDRTTARKYINQAIELVKKRYTKSEIENLVNGTNVECKDMAIVGSSNPIRELYILKSDMEDINPSFKAKTVVENMLATEDRLYEIKYRTDW